MIKHLCLFDFSKIALFLQIGLIVDIVEETDTKRNISGIWCGTTADAIGMGGHTGNLSKQGAE